VNGETARRFGPDDLAFGEDLARRAAVAIDNALLHSELREVADRLQAAVSPPELPVVDGWRLSASYRSAGRVSVGGDFYDAIPLHGGRLALAIGDVMGRGVEAAASMAQIRSALRAFVAVDPDPQVVLSRLDTLYERFPSEQLVTLLYALADPERDQVVLCCAGHPPPFVLSRDGSGEFLDGVRGTILGVGRAERRRTVAPLRTGDTLVLYTDGLLERRGEDLQMSKDRLLATARDLAGTGRALDLDRLAELVRDPDRDDDVAVLGACRT
jgi:serine phosphatase RsbU (regulator of sigma subunit)